MTDDHNGRTGTPSAQSGESPNNIVLFSIDSLRADHCGFLGCDRDTTPVMDQLASDGVVYETAIAPGPRTPSSMPVAFTGQFTEPAEFSWGDWGLRYGRISDHLRRHETIQDKLQAAGYTTIGVTVNPWTQSTDFDTGFDEFVEITGETVVDNGSSRLLSTLDAVMNGTNLTQRFQWDLTRDWFVQWPHYYETILDTLEPISKPYFLWVFSLDPHQPYLAPGQYRAESSLLSMYYANFRESAGNSEQADIPRSIQNRLKRAYRDAVRSADGFVGRLLNDLKGDPTTIIHSDHGEAFGEHGYWGHPSELYEESIRVPLIVSNGPASARIEKPVSLRCLPDLLSSVVAQEPFEPGAFSHEYVMTTTEGLSKFALRGDGWKYIVDDESEELYDLQSDPGEQTDRSAERPETTSELRQLLAHERQAASEHTKIAKAAQRIREAPTNRERVTKS